MIALAKIEHDDLVSFTPDQLKERLRQTIEVTSSGMYEMARLYSRLVELGEDVSEFQTGLFVWLPSIAAGTVMPELVVALAGRISLLKRVAELPPHEQARLVNGGTIKVVEKHGETFDVRKLPLSSLVIRADLVKQVFGERCIRTETAQIAYLSAIAPTVKPSARVQQGNIVYDPKTKCVRIGRASSPVEDMVAVLKKAGITW